MRSGTKPEPVVVGVDIGGTSVKGMVAGRDGDALSSQVRPTPVGWHSDAVIDVVVDVIEALRDDVRPHGRPVAVGLVMPGVVDRAAGIARYSANIGWQDLPIRRLVSDRVGLPVAVEHDVRAATIAEARHGAARGVDDVLFVSIGTGIAAGAVVGGTVLCGAAGLAGEVGHMPVYPDGEACTCGQRGCAEAYASGAAVARRYAAQTGAPPVAAEEVIARAGRGDEVAGRVLDEALVGLARVVLGCVLMTDPGIVVLAGGMAQAGVTLTGPLTLALERSMVWRSPPPVVISAFGPDAGSRGAVLLAWTEWEAATRRTPGPAGPHPSGRVV